MIRYEQITTANTKKTLYPSLLCDRTTGSATSTGNRLKLPTDSGMAWLRQKHVATDPAMVLVAFNTAAAALRSWNSPQLRAGTHTSEIG